MAQEVLDKFTAMQESIDALGTKVQELEARSKFLTLLETLLSKANQDASGAVDENAVDVARIQVLETLIKLSSSRLQV